MSNSHLKLCENKESSRHPGKTTKLRSVHQKNPHDRKALEGTHAGVSNYKNKLSENMDFFTV